MKTFSQTHFIPVPTLFHMYQVVAHYRESIWRKRNGTVVVSFHKTYYVLRKYITRIACDVGDTRC